MRSFVHHRLAYSIGATSLLLASWLVSIHAQNFPPLISSTTPLSKPADVKNEQTAPPIRYEEDKGGVKASLELSSYGLGQTLVFSIEHGQSKLPTLEDQGHLLAILLKRLLQDHAEINSAYVTLGGNREALFPTLDEYLLHSPLWDHVHGRPFHGQLGRFLVDVINSQDMMKPLTQTFNANGFEFKLEGVGRIDIEKISSMQNARLPVHIDIMGFQAKKVVGTNLR